MSDTETSDTTDTTEAQPDDSTEDSGAMRGPSEYDVFEVIDHERFRNGDETIVVMSSFSEGYQVYAMEVNASGDILALEEIGSDETERDARGMAKFWLKQNPNGILGASEDDDGGGMLDGLFGGGS